MYSALLTSASKSPKTPTPMAKKQPPPPPAPPSSSSEEEEESSSGDDEETTTTNTHTPTVKQEQEEETDEESESGSSDDEDDDEDDEKPQSISIAASPALKPFDAGEKSNGKGNANGKALFQRIWSLEDEIAILEAMAKFEPRHGPIKLNAAGIRDFHEFVKGSLSLEVSGAQLLEKIKRLKKKYESAAARVKNGKAVKFGKPHDEKVYELSKKVVWGMGTNNEVKKEVKVVKSKNAANDVGGSLKREYPFMKDAMANARCGMSADLLETLDPEKMRPLENEFKKQKVLEIENNIRGTDLMKQALQLVLEDIENMAD